MASQRWRSHVFCLTVGLSCAVGGWAGRLPLPGMAQTWQVLWRLRGSAAMETALKALCPPGGPCRPRCGSLPCCSKFTFPPFLSSSQPAARLGADRNRNYVLTIKTGQLSRCLMAMCPASEAPKSIASWGAKSPWVTRFI